MNERWLMDREGQRGSYGGQPVRLEDDWVIRNWSWFPDGTRALVAEQRLPNRPDPVEPLERHRLRIIRFPARFPTRPLPIVDLDALDLSWTVPYDVYVGMAAREVAGRHVPGKHSGEAVLNFTGLFAGGTWSVDYHDYSDDGRTFVSGTESLDTPLPILRATWTADLTTRGDRAGFLRGQLEVSGPGRFTGPIESEVNGVRFDHVPVQADCPGLPQPPLHIERASAQALGWRHLLVSVRVTAELPEDPVRRPVRMATVEVAGQKTRTDRFGRAWLLVPGRPGTTLEIESSAGTFKSASATVRARLAPFWPWLLGYGG